MYIRRTRIGKTATGEPYFTHRLVRSRRVGDKVRQETLLNLGRHFGVDREQWRPLCDRVEQILSGQAQLFAVELSGDVEQEAQRIAQQLIARQSETTACDAGRQEALADIQEVDVASLEMSRPRSVGVEHVGLWAMEQAGFMDLLQEAGLNGPQRAAAVGSIIGRMASPGSERATNEWLKNESGLGELMGEDFEQMHPMRLYRVSDLLLRRREFLEDRLFSRVSEIFGLSCTVTLYDLTNTYFEGEASSNPRACRGHSKEKRSDCPLLTLGLILDGSGFVRRSDIFAGNVSEAGTLAGMLHSLDAPAHALVVMDRGIATEANITWLREHGYRYLVMSRERKRQFDGDGAVCIETASREKVHVHKELSDDDEEVRLYCYSEMRAKKEQGIVQRFAERFEKGLAAINAGLSRPRTVKKLEKIHERIGRLKEKSRGAGQMYRIEVIPDETGTKARAIHWKKQLCDGTMATHPGVCCLRSNLMDWDEERLWRTYTMLTDLEAVFRSLKSELGLRPVYHHKKERSDGHLFITVLAYQFVQIIRRQLRERGITDSWAGLRTILSRQQRVTATFRRADGRTLHVRKATLPESGQKKIYQELGMDMAPGGVKKLVV